MKTFKIIFSALLLLVFSALDVRADDMNADTTTTVETTTTTTPNISTPAPSPSEVKGRAMIVSPVPSLKEEIATPTGYVNCFTIEAGWYKNAWVPEHRICQYESSPGQTVTYEGVAWVDSYWACTAYTETTCTKWEWKPGHWVKTLEAY